LCPNDDPHVGSYAHHPGHHEAYHHDDHNDHHDVDADCPAGDRSS
jgi:hypothetical protein